MGLRGCAKRRENCAYSHLGVKKATGVGREKLRQFNLIVPFKIVSYETRNLTTYAMSSYATPLLSRVPPTSVTRLFTSPL